MTAKSTGTYYEKKSIEFLKKIGYTHFERALAKTIWIKGRPISLHHDFFGCGDIIAIGPKGIAIIQVKFEGEKTGLWLAKVRREMQDLPNPKCECGAITLMKCIHIWRKGKKKPEVELV